MHLPAAEARRKGATDGRPERSPVSLGNQGADRKSTAGRRALFRHRCDYFFRVSCGAEIYRPYFCDLHNTSPFPLIYDSLLADKICFMNFFPSV